MTERIKELAEESGFEVDQFGLYWDEDSNTDGVDLERFAKRIIGDCLMKVYGAKIRSESYDELIRRIREDYGVEE